MKIPYKQIEQFVQSPNPQARVILVYGPDSGLMKERAQTMGKSVVQDLNDPFNVAVLSSDMLKDDPARLADEAGAISMMGGDRLVRIENADDSLTVLLKDYLEAPQMQTLIILEAGELTPRSSLRKLCEKEDNAAALPCYVEDERDLSRFIRDRAQEDGKMIDADTVSWLASNIAGNRARARSEIEKLLLYKGNDNTPINLQDAHEACGQAGAQGLDDLVYLVGGGQTGGALSAFNKLLEEGVPFIVILRSLQNHFRRLHIVRSQTETGASIDTAMKSLRPPVFFKQERSFQAQAQRWPGRRLLKILERLADIEADCKKTGAPTDTLCAQAVLGVCSIRA